MEGRSSAAGGGSVAQHRAEVDRLGRWLAWLALLVAAGFAYRGLAGWDPSQADLPEVEAWLFFTDKSSPTLVYALALVVLVRNRQRLRHALVGEPAPLRALPVLALAAALFLWARRVQAPDLELISLAIFLVGGGLWLAGWKLARALLPSAILLSFAAPKPDVLVNHVAFPMQLWTARAASWLLELFGLPVLQEGDTVIYGGHAFQVIESCGGLRSMEVLTLLALGFVFLVPMRRLHAVLLVALAPVIGLAVNLLRVAALITNPHSDIQAAHTVQGVLMFLTGILLFAALDRALLRVLPRPAPPVGPEEPQPAPTRSGPPLRAVGALTGVLAAMGVATLVVPPFEEPVLRVGRRPTLPQQVATWHSEPIPVEAQFLAGVRMMHRSSRRYERDGEAVSALLAYDDRQRRDVSLLSPKTRFPGSGWDLEERGVLPLPGGPFEALVFRSGPRRRLVYQRRQGAKGLANETLRAAIALDRSPFGRRTPVRMLRLETELSNHPGGREEAHQRLQSLLSDLEPHLNP